MREMQATYQSLRSLIQIQSWSILKFGVNGTLSVYKILGMIKPENDSRVQQVWWLFSIFLFEELHFKYYNSTDLLVAGQIAVKLFWICFEKNLWKRPLGCSRAMIQKDENWWLNESNVCQRVRRFCFAFCYGGWSRFLCRLRLRWFSEKNCSKFDFNLLLKIAILRGCPKLGTPTDLLLPICF